jgi:hypothetical protein
VLYVFLLVVILGLWRFLQRYETHAWPAPVEDRADDAPGEAPASVDPDPLRDLARALAEGLDAVAPTPEATGLNGSAPAPPTFERRYAVKWTDRSRGVQVPHEKRDLSLRQAMRDAGWIAQHARRYYPGPKAERSPFAELRVYLQCLCGRDVADLTRPHTIPGEDRVCPYSGAEGSQPTIPVTGGWDRASAGATVIGAASP